MLSNIEDGMKWFSIHIIGVLSGNNRLLLKCQESQVLIPYHSMVFHSKIVNPKDKEKS